MDKNNDINDEVIRDFLKKSSGKDFETPKDYFEGFQSKVHSKIHQEKRSWWLLPKVRVAAASFACLAISIFLLNDFNENIEVAKVELNQGELLAYYADNIDEISEDEILDIMTEDDFASMSQTVAVDSTKTKEPKENSDKEETPTLDDFTDEEIYEYMLDEGYGSGDWDNL